MRPSIGRKYHARIPKLNASFEERESWPIELHDAQTKI